MTHGDDAGLILPPRLAPIQVHLNSLCVFCLMLLAQVEMYFDVKVFVIFSVGMKLYHADNMSLKVSVS